MTEMTPGVVDRIVSDEPGTPDVDPAIEGRSPGRAAWIRLWQNRSARISAYTLIVLFLLAAFAPVISKLYGVGPDQAFMGQINENALPLGYFGGISGSHWLGLEPRSGDDIFIRLLYGMRNSLIIAVVAATISSVIGVFVGIVAGYIGGAVDKGIAWLVDFLLVLPFLLFAIVTLPLLENSFFGARGAIPNSFEMSLIILIFVVFGWMGTARLVRGQVVSLREREYVEAARAAGAGGMHIMFRQILPNLWAPILVTFSLALPSYVTGEAALHFLGIGLGGDSPDFGTMIFASLNYMQTDPAYTFIPGVVILLLVLAFNMFGDALRDALDPKSSR
jgi:peptide/nickel transport system permease protein